MHKFISLNTYNCRSQQHKTLKHMVMLLLYKRLKTILRRERENKHLRYHLIQNPSSSSEETAHRKISKGNIAGQSTAGAKDNTTELFLSRHLNQKKSGSRWELVLTMSCTSYWKSRTLYYLQNHCEASKILIQSLHFFLLMLCFNITKQFLFQGTRWDIHWIVFPTTYCK